MAILPKSWFMRLASLYAGTDFGLDLQETVYALDSSTIDLCLSMFPWARFRETSHRQDAYAIGFARQYSKFYLDYWRQSAWCQCAGLSCSGTRGIYFMDRAYLDFQRLYHMHQCSAIFVIRSKTNTGLRRLYSQQIDKTTNVRCDKSLFQQGLTAIKIIRTTSPHQILRCWKGKDFSFLTNQFSLPLLQSQNFIAAGGEWKYFLNGSNSIWELKVFTAHLRSG